MDKARLLIETQLLADVVLHDGRRRRGQRDHRRRAQRRQIAAQQPVIGPEIVPPLRNAMRLIDRDQRRFPLRQHLRKPGHAQALGRDEQELQLAVQIIDTNLPRRRAVASRMDAFHREARVPAASRNWSSISAISGLITSVVPPRASPGSW